ncbi:MAG TPA: hypothetical protein ENO30_06290 [Thermodesulfobium narugense]|nr:hypothetical protein [Thermodesulfobium narugense]
MKNFDVDATRGVIIWQGSIYQIEELPFLIQEFYEPEDTELENTEWKEYEETIKLLEEYGF